MPELKTASAILSPSVAARLVRSFIRNEIPVSVTLCGAKVCVTREAPRG
jgi:hypothetical protein